jgi:predicted nucleic acid-binding protein
MTLYLDSSAIVKVYVEETSSDRVRELVFEADALLTARITYAEVRAAFARCRRERQISLSDLRTLIRMLDGDWGSYSIVEVSDAVVRHAAALSERHALRAYDAVQLAAALTAADAIERVHFACFDERLARSARQEGLVPVSD